VWPVLRREPGSVRGQMSGESAISVLGGHHRAADVPPMDLASQSVPTGMAGFHSLRPPDEPII